MIDSLDSVNKGILFCHLCNNITLVAHCPDCIEPAGFSPVFCATFRIETSGVGWSSLMEIDDLEDIDTDSHTLLRPSTRRSTSLAARRKKDLTAGTHRLPLGFSSPSTTAEPTSNGRKVFKKKNASQKITQSSFNLTVREE